jgi:hypothetical protein
LRQSLQIFIALLFLNFNLLSQNKSYLEFTGKTVKNYKALAGVKIIIFSGNLKITEVTTGRNGRFMFDLELGVDYTIYFNAPGCAEMYAKIFSSGFSLEKIIYPVYEIDVNFFELNQSNLNYEMFKQPFTKIVFDGKDKFNDEENYVDNFIKELYFKPEIVQNKEELHHTEQEENNILKNKLKEEEVRLLKEKQLFAEKKAFEDAERMKKLLTENIKATSIRLNKKVDADNDIITKLKNEDIYLKISFERKKITETQNKTIKKNIETNLLKSVAENERILKSKSKNNNLNIDSDNEIITVLKREALAKVNSQDLRISAKIKNKQLQLYESIFQKEIFSQLKIVVKNEKNIQATIKKQPVVGITTEFEQHNFKSVYYINVSEGNDRKNNFRKEKYIWGIIYYFKNDKPINEQDYFSELKRYNVPL